MEDALAQNREDVRGQAFLVTGKDPAWSLNDTREAVKVNNKFLYNMVA